MSAPTRRLDAPYRSPARRIGLALSAVLVVAVLLGAALAADRWAHAEAERRIGGALIDAADDVSGLSVDVAGFPFLLQYATGSLREVRLQADSVAYAGLDYTDVDVTARGVPASGEGTIDEARMSALIPGETLTRAAQEDPAIPENVEVAAQDGQLVVTARYLGFALEADMVPRAQGREIAVDVLAVRMGGVTVQVDSLPGFLGDLVQDLRIGMEALPEGVQLTDVTVEDDAVRIAVAGQDVPVPQV
ncbi:DUF2993 domain-containing protein [Sediminivirga luteola]|uniref:DUF2993 family protein n=1 Tax=Sediminivirga luteola TaxID=1774748 RepID=A0A8J2U0H3_9MICO|nr:DUF2993 domain-containing protein [Sediminivirga luteola]MCI2265350.1 DUF2993 domain-containing protein [Sediminivirga luteola]GGA24612.1 hypothetical protein GCM10011333_29570 [Sediminivirga luteola]